MGDTITEIESAVTQVQNIMPVLGGVISAFAPAVGPEVTLAAPVLSIINEILAAIETLKGTGMAHASAVAVIGQAVSSIGTTLSAAVPSTAAVAASPLTVAPPPPPPHESNA